MTEPKVKPADANPTSAKTTSKKSSSKPKSKSSNGDSVTETKDRQPYKDVDGNQIDAPVIASFERELHDAQTRADVNDIDEITERYHKARDEKVKRDNAAEKKRRQEANS